MLCGVPELLSLLVRYLHVQLKFEDDLRITMMYSGEGEEVALLEELYPRGNVEDWMLRIEDVMKESIRQIIKRSLDNYEQVSAAKWKK